jgi:forespore regulator of the sigma-K checkpoint
MLPKNGKKILGILCCLIVIGFVSSFAGAEESTNNNRTSSEDTQEEVFAVNGPRTIEVILKREYLDGEVSVEKVNEQILSMEDFWAQYEDWKLVEEDEGAMVFKKEVDDISPLLKANGYFGVSDDGTLTIFKGKPGSNQVIQSFFQIDMEKLESNQHQMLKKGIPVQSKDNYHEIINSFKGYSLN